MADTQEDKDIKKENRIKNVYYCPECGKYLDRISGDSWHEVLKCNRECQCKYTVIYGDLMSGTNIKYTIERFVN